MITGPLKTITMVMLILSPLAAAHHAIAPIEATICKIMQDPSHFKGKIVRVTGRIFWGMEDTDLYEDCTPQYRGGMVIQFPDDAPELKPGFHLVRDSAFEKFYYYLTAAPVKKFRLPPNVGSPWVPHRYCSMTVTITGRFYSVSEAEVLHGRGYGNAGESRFALVVKSVSNPVAQECPPPSGLNK
ncbi:MAG TPA: hypothetical protein VG028_00720 [Terriglobia bacterium]|nr:hypothetical protein [Terriglobia bacterium]